MNTRTWLLWLTTSAILISCVPHPLYLALIFLSIALVFTRWHNDAPLAHSYGLFLRVGGVIFLSYLVFSIVTIGGARGGTTLLALPALTLPAWLGGLMLGGPLTAETLAWGATRGLQIWTLMALFGSFNALVDHYRLLRLTPRALFHAGLAVTIAIVFVPALVRSTGEIMEAQRARGHRFRGLKSWLPLIAPLLASSLEKAIQLAEALDSRGYGRTTQVDQHGTRRQLVIIFGLFLLTGGLVAWLYYGQGSIQLLAFAAMLIGGSAILWTLYQLGQLVTRSRYNREHWHRHDTFVVATCLLVIAIIVILRTHSLTLFVYYPFPQISAPSFDPRIGLTILLLAAPAIATNREPRTENKEPRTENREPRTENREQGAANGEPRTVL